MPYSLHRPTAELITPKRLHRLGPQFLWTLYLWLWKMLPKKSGKIRIRIRIFPEKSGFRKRLAGSGSICLCVIYICQTPSTSLKKSGSGRRVAGKPAKPPSLDMKINSTLILPFSFSNFLSLVWMKTFKNVTVHRYCDLSILWSKGMSVILSVCLFPNSSEMVNPNEL